MTTKMSQIYERTNVQNAKVEPNILGTDSHVTIALKTFQKAIAINEYYTQQRVILGLHNLIVAILKDNNLQTQGPIF